MTMSQLQRKWAKAKLDATAAEFDERDEDMETGPGPELAETVDDDSSSASSVSSTGTVIPSPGHSLFARPQGVARGRSSMEQTPWTAYFERELFLPFLDDDEGGADGESITYHAYLISPVGKGPLFVMHHGAGSSGLSFAVLSAEIRKRLPNAGILAPDARGHGSTTDGTGRTTRQSATDSNDNYDNKNGGSGGSSSGSSSSREAVDLSLATLATDLRRVVTLTAARMKWPTLPPLVLVGHSLGGAVVTELASRGAGSGSGSGSSGGDVGLGDAVLGYAVLDVVEGSAMDALQSMQTYLATRPQGFATLRDGIEWHVRSRTVRNAVSARASVPGLLVRDESDRFPTRPWRWRTDLAATQPFWEGWFAGLSKKFLGARGGKMLLLAGTDRLDTELTIGQMQGKYALQVFPEAGHFVHEDLPEKTAIALVDFHRRNDRSALVLPPKISELLAQGKRV